MPQRRWLGAVVAAALFLTAACKEDGTGIKIDSLKFTGLQAVTAGQLESVLATQAPSWLPWGAKTYFNREQFEADLKRIVAFYRDRGYPDARVTSFEAALNDDQTAVDLTIHIDEGEPVRLEALRIEGLPGGDGLDEPAVRERLPLQAGQPLDRALVQASRETMLDQLKEHGYPYGTVTLAEQDGSSAKSKIVTMQVEPGALVHFGPIEITGNSSVGDNVIRRQLSFKPGDVYQQSKLLDSQRRLYGLELFQFASVKAQTQEVAPLVPTLVTLTEGKHRRLNLGVGYGSEEKARAEVNWRHVNFFGGARTAGVVARYSSLDRGVRLNFSQPYVFSRNYSLTASGQMWHSDEPAFTLDSGGGRLTVMRRFGWIGGRGLRSGGPSTTYVSMTYANELEDYVVDPGVLDDPTQWDDLISIGIDPRTGKGHGQLSSLSFDGGRDTTGYILDARHGYVLNGHVEQAGQWLGGSYDYREVTAEARYYQSVGNAVVVAVRARAGSIDGAGADPLSSQVPFFKRYFLGGATTLRGWGRYEVAPLALNGAPIGGLTTFNFSTELRFPVWKKLGGVVFLDGGNVWRQPWDYNLDDLHYDVGPGLRYDTPIGPVRVDLGYQLDRIPGLLVNGEPEPRRFRVHFSIGQAF